MKAPKAMAIEKAWSEAKILEFLKSKKENFSNKDDKEKFFKGLYKIDLKSMPRLIRIAHLCDSSYKKELREILITRVCNYFNPIDTFWILKFLSLRKEELNTLIFFLMERLFIQSLRSQSKQVLRYMYKNSVHGSKMQKEIKKHLNQKS
jgi:hypothetical protein